MKKLSTFVLMAFLIVCLSGCGVNHYYAKKKPFKPDRHNKVQQCKTYGDVLIEPYKYQKKAYRGRN